MTVYSSKSYLAYLNGLIDHNNTHHHSIDTKPFNAEYTDLTEKINTNIKTPKFKVNYRVRIAKYKKIFSKGYTENWSKEIIIIDSVSKATPWT